MKWLNSLRSAIQRRRALNELRSLTKGEATDQQWAFKDAIADAREALDRDLRERALELWSQASSRFPDFAMTSAPAFDLLVELRLYDEAEALMNRGLRKYRRGEHFFEGLAFLAYKRGDWNESVARCGVLRKKHPANSKAYLIAAAALSELGRASEAESILLQGIGARPEDVGLRIEYARLAERKEDWTLAIGRWAEVFDNFGHLAGAIGTAKILSKLGRHDEANSALLKILHKAGTEIVVWVTYAEIAESQGDLGEAADRWGRVQKKFPLNSIGYHRSASMLVQLDRHTEAEAVLRAGIERFPNEPLLCIGYAEIAHQAGNWVEASHRWALVQDRFPDRMEVRERGGRALDAIAHRDQAARQQTTEVSLCKVDNFHQNPEPKVQTITDDLSPVAYIDRAKTKIQEGAIDEAHTILLLMLERFPGDRGALENLAKVAERRQDWPSMELYLRQVLQQGRCPWWTYVDLARSLVKQGSPQGAQAILDQAHQEFPDEAAVYAESARVAGVQGEWQRELECWLQVRSCVEAGGGSEYPFGLDRDRLADIITRTQDHIDRVLNFESKSKNRFSAYVIHNSGFGLFAPVEAISGLKIDQFGLCFESLGFNCELGFIQRSCGAEPLSLTRFSGISIAEMTRGLQEGFCRLAFPENLTAERPGSEWDIRDRTYNLAYHTFLNIDEISEEDLILQQAKRLKFVLRKYLEDISDAEKIFVIWRNAKPLDAQEVACLRAAIRIHGDPTVLWISQAGDEPFGLVERLEPKLLRGYVEGYTPQGNGAWLHYWLPVLLNAFKLDQAEKR